MLHPRARPALAGLFVISALGLAGCQSPDNDLKTLPTLTAETGDSLPHNIQSKPLNLDRFHAPAQLAGLRTDGVITRPDGGGWRQWRYRDAGTLMALTVYGLPGGWQGLTPKRIVAGHYGQLRQRKVNAVYDSDDQALNFVKERLFDLDGHITAIGQMLINAPDRTPTYELLLLTLDGDHFVRLNLVSRKPNTQRLARLAKIALAEFRKKNGE